MLAAFKLRAVPINVNYRYVEDELRYLLDDADAVAVVFHREFAPKLAAIRASLPKLQTFIAVADDDNDDARAPTPPPSPSTTRPRSPTASPDRDFAPALRRRSLPPLHRRDHRHAQGRDVAPRRPLLRRDGGRGWRRRAHPHARGDRRPLPRAAPTLRPDLPVHARHRALDGVQHACSWAAPSSSPPSTTSTRMALWQLVAREQANYIVIVGDAFARPLLDALDHRDGRSLDLSCMHVVLSGGAILSPSLKRAFVERLPGAARRRRLRRVGDRWSGSVGRRGGRRRSRPRRGSASATTPRCWAPTSTRCGVGVVGRLARRGHIPLGYYKDAAKTAATFPVVDGVRWAVPGDHAVVETDGSITLLGRGSVSINTGGEKVYPEEVESVLKAPRRRLRRRRRRRSRRPLGRAGRRDRATARRRDAGARRVAAPQPRPSRRLQGPARGRARRRDRALTLGQARLPVGPRRRDAHARAGRGMTRNRLADETSPYLRQHADNPVDWMPWGDEAFATRRERRCSRVPLGRLLVVPLVSRDGPRVVRGRGDRGRHERSSSST